MSSNATRRWLRAIMSLVALASVLVPFSLAPPPVAAAEPEDLIFPVVGDHYYSDTFGACRSGCSRTHEGVDIMTYGVKGVPVVAADDGYIRSVNWARHAEDIDPARCCTIQIQHDDGFRSSYIHLNNDTPGTDDGHGWGIAPGILPGVRVVAGQLIGWVGDSGNAESTGPQLHFEYHDADGTVLNPTPYVDGATHISAPIVPDPFTFDASGFRNIDPPNYSTMSIDSTDPSAPWSIEIATTQGVKAFIASGTGSQDLQWNGAGYPVGPFVGTADFGQHGTETFFVQIGSYDWPFVDDEGTYAEDEIAEAFERGITYGCDWNRFCPDDLLTRAEVIAMLGRAAANGSALPTYQGHYSDVDGSDWFAGEIEYLIDAGILSPGGSFGPDVAASRAYVIDVLMSVVQGPSGYGPYQGYFTDVPEDAWFRSKVEKAHELGIVMGYPDGTFRPYSTLTREEAAALIMRGL